MIRTTRWREASAGPDHSGSESGFAPSSSYSDQDATTSKPRIAEGKTKAEATRSLKRYLSNVVYRTLLADQETRVSGEDKRCPVRA